MDPLSVAASIAGPLKAAKEVSSLIGSITAGRKTGAREINDVKITVDMLSSVLLHIQLLLLSREAINPKRASLVMAEEVVVTLSACVITFSDLDSCVKGLAADNKLGYLDSVRLSMKAPDLKKYLQYLETHKSSLSLILNILTCQSAQNAESSAEDLKLMMSRVLESNDSLARRMANMEASFSQYSVKCASISSRYQPDTILDHTKSQHCPNSRVSFIPISDVDDIPYTTPQRSFENDLSTSRVYQRSAVRGSAVFSIDTSEQLTQSWSVLSGISLSMISSIAIQSLPIFASDLGNSSLYDFKSTCINQSQPVKSFEMSPNTTSTILSGTLLSPLKTRMSNKTIRNPIRRRHSSLPIISAPVFISSTHKCNTFDLPIILRQKISQPTLVSSTYRFNTFELPSRPPRAPTNQPTTSTTRRLVKVRPQPHVVLFLAMSSRDYNGGALTAGGYPFLSHGTSEIFDVLDLNGILWFAINQESSMPKKGWIWSENFIKLEETDEDLGHEEFE